MRYKVIYAATGAEIHHTCGRLTRDAANRARKERQGTALYPGLLAVVEQGRPVRPFPDNAALDKLREVIARSPRGAIVVGENGAICEASWSPGRPAD